MENRDNVHEGHRERVRKRFESEGLSAFTPYQVLELLLFYAFPRCDTNVLAHRLIDKFGSIDKVFEADINSLTEVEGIGRNSAVLLSMMSELSQYYFRARFNKKGHIDNYNHMGDYFCSKIGMEKNEVFAAAAFDARRREITFRKISEGHASQTTVQLRRLVEFALSVNAEIIVIAHNHVSGDVQPSDSDRISTKKICERLYDLGVKVSDHIIVSGDSYYSFAANGLMPI